MANQIQGNDFSDQVILVTGGASGIGLASANLIAQRGGHVIVADINEAAARSAAREIVESGGRAHAEVLDVSSQSLIQEVVNRSINEFGAIHALVNSAGIAGPTGINVEEISETEFAKVMKINLYGAIWLTQALIPGMKNKNYGRIVHVASIAGKEGNPGMAPYNTSKSGLIGFVKGVSKEVAPFGVTINTVAPALISTVLNNNVSEETLKYMLSKIPIGRAGNPKEVAEIIAFAASKSCSFTTGFTFDISGGRATY